MKSQLLRIEVGLDVVKQLYQVGGNVVGWL